MKLRTDDRTRRTVTFFINFVSVVILTVVFYKIWMRYFLEFAYFYKIGNYAITAVYSIFLVMFNVFFGGYNIGYAKVSDLIFSQMIAMFFANTVLYVIADLVARYIVPARPFVIYFLVEVAIATVLLIISNLIYYHIFPPRKAILIYEQDDPSVEMRIRKYQANSYTIETKEEFKDAREHFEELKNYDCVIASGLTSNHKSRLVHACYEMRRNIYIIPDVYDVIVNSATNVYLVDTPVFKAGNFGPSQTEKIFKRVFDIFFAVVLLVLASPFMLVTALAIKLEDHGPVFYKQTRLTQYGREFGIIKFRSMRVDAEKDGVARLASEHDSRITKVGRFIRACRIDELPQLINILKGDMSVVGPRPERPELIKDILKEVPEFNYRLAVKAGLTGYAQVYGKYNTKTKDKLLFDLIYIENYSFFLDIRIMFMTFKILFMKESTEGVEDEAHE